MVPIIQITSNVTSVVSSGDEHISTVIYTILIYSVYVSQLWVHLVGYKTDKILGTAQIIWEREYKTRSPVSERLRSSLRGHCCCRLQLKVTREES